MCKISFQIILEGLQNIIPWDGFMSLPVATFLSIFFHKRDSFWSWWGTGKKYHTMSSNHHPTFQSYISSLFLLLCEVWSSWIFAQILLSGLQLHKSPLIYHFLLIIQLYLLVLSHVSPKHRGGRLWGVYTSSSIHLPFLMPPLFFNLSSVLRFEKLTSPIPLHQFLWISSWMLHGKVDQSKHMDHQW